MTNDKTREDFEAWARARGLIYESHGLMSVSSSLELFWEAWQAARAQPAITSESGNQADQEASAITSVPLDQALTDPENQPNQYGVEFLLRGPKFAFRVGAQQFTLDYEPTETGEFEFMRDMLIHAFSTFTPDVKTAQAAPLLTDAEIRSAADACDDGQEDAEYTLAFGRKIESLVRSKLGAGVPMTPAELDKAMQAMFYPARNRAFVDGVRAAEAFHGIGSKT